MFVPLDVKLIQKHQPFGQTWGRFVTLAEGLSFALSPRRAAIETGISSVRTSARLARLKRSLWPRVDDGGAFIPAAWR